MALTAIPDEINRHLVAALDLSKREILLRILSEAEFCLNSEQLAAATILAGIVWEEASRLINVGCVAEEQDHVTIWNEMRDRASHSTLARTELNAEQVRAMLTGTTAMLDRSHGPMDDSAPFSPLEERLTKIRGKYAFVTTSVDQFLERKHKDVELEDRK